MFFKPKNGTYKLTVQCPCGGPSMSIPVEVTDPGYVEFLEQQNKRFKEALECYANQTHCEIHDKNVAREALGIKEEVKE